MNQKRLSRKAAEVIEVWVMRSGGKIIKVDGYRCQIRIEGIVSITTVVLEEWLELGANVFFVKGLMNISNWPEAERVFKVRTKGEVNRDGLHHYLMKDLWWAESVISVEEV